MGYIYKIVNDINGKIYVGKTNNSIDKRFKEHLHDAKKERCKNRPLYKAINKYGEDKFHIEEIEYVSTDIIACEREQFWINELRTYVGFKDCCGYNATLGGDSKKYKDYDINELINMYYQDYDIKKIASIYNLDYSYVLKLLKANNIKTLSIKEGKSRKNGRKLYQIDINTLEIIYEYNCLADANIALGKNPSSGNIHDVMTGRNGRRVAYGYYWCFKDKYEDFINEMHLIAS